MNNIHHLLQHIKWGKININAFSVPPKQKNMQTLNSVVQFTKQGQGTDFRH